MKMKKYYFSVLFLFVFAGISSAQAVLDIKHAIDLYNTTKMREGDFFKTLSESEIEGSPYLNDDFISGTLITTTNTKYVDVPLRYNIYNDNIEFDTGNEIQALGAPEIVDKIEMGNIKMVYVPYSVSKKINRGFFIIEEEGKASLLSKPEVTFYEATKPAAYSDAQPAKFERKADSYFIRVDQAEAKLISGKNDMVDVFPDNQDKLESYIKKNKLKHRKPEDLKKLVQYYNSL